MRWRHSMLILKTLSVLYFNQTLLESRMCFWHKNGTLRHKSRQRLKAVGNKSKMSKHLNWLLLEFVECGDGQDLKSPPLIAGVGSTPTSSMF